MSTSLSLISAQVILHAAAAEPEAITSKNIASFLPGKKPAARAIHAFRQLGFETGALAGTSFSITGPAGLFETTFSVKIKTSGKGVTSEAHDGAAGTRLPVEALPEHIAALVQDIVLPLPPAFGPAAY